MKRAVYLLGLGADPVLPAGELPPGFSPASIPFFDEDAYLKARPDVDAAIKQGQFLSAWQHYEMHGKNEGMIGEQSKPAGEVFVKPGIVLGHRGPVSFRQDWGFGAGAATPEGVTMTHRGYDSPDGVWYGTREGFTKAGARITPSFFFSGPVQFDQRGYNLIAYWVKTLLAAGWTPEGVPVEASYQDQEGTPLTAEEFARVEQGFPLVSYAGPDGEPITKAQFDTWAASPPVEYRGADDQPITKEQYEAMLRETTVIRATPPRRLLFAPFPAGTARAAPVFHRVGV